jgi:tetratricopeptide (TPR) repeat protein
VDGPIAQFSASRAAQSAQRPDTGRLSVTRGSSAAQRFAIDNGLPATLSPRHVQRLIAGTRSDGRPLGQVRTATRHLLESMLGHTIDELLAAPGRPDTWKIAPNEAGRDLMAQFTDSERIDERVIELFQEKINTSRQVDRKLGARPLLAELHDQIWHLSIAMTHTLNRNVRGRLAGLVVDVCALAGWLSLDSGAVLDAWNFYERAKAAARDAESPPLHAYACAAQSVILLDIGRLAEARELTDRALAEVAGQAPRMLLAWLTAAHGEALAAWGDRRESLLTFDRAATLIDGSDPAETPYLVFGGVHLARWRGSALAELGERAAIDELTTTLDALDLSFTRARASAHADLAKVLFVHGEREAAVENARTAHDLALRIGSVRQCDRVRPHVSED